jgi:hypothetical protein
MQVEIVSMAEELGSGQPLAAIPGQSAAALSGAALGGWTVINDFGDVINPWGPTGFSGTIDPRS